MRIVKYIIFFDKLWFRRKVFWYMCVSFSISLLLLFISFIGVNDFELFDVIFGMKIMLIGSFCLDSIWCKLYFLFFGIYYK